MGKVICIDPGHGGYDPGTHCLDNSLQEKDFNLAVALDLKKILEGLGITVVMTRTTDDSPEGITDLTKELQARCDISNAAGADLFLSIHANAGGGVGCEAYVWPGGVGATVGNDLTNALAPTMGVHGEAVKDGGPNGRHLYVICNTNAPAVLIEVGFMDSSDITKLKDHLHQFAGMLAVPLSKFLGGIAPAPVAAGGVSQVTLTTALDNHSAATDAKIADALAALQAQFDVTVKALIAELKG